jgi:DNA uptake protein ComE-like DNA-binding protein
MINVNAVDKNLLYEALWVGLRDDGDPNSMRADELAAQLAVNIVDHRDLDVAVTTLTVGPKTYYGFEAQPFINEIAFRISSDNAHDPSNNYFAIELYNPFQVDIPLSEFMLEIRDVNDTVIKTVTLTGYVISAGNRFVIVNNEEAASRFGIDNLISTGGGKEDPNLVLAEYALVSADPPAYVLSDRYDIYLRRIMPAEQLYLDRQKTQDEWFTWSDIMDVSQFYCRDDGNGNCIYQNFQSATNTLGAINGTTGLRRNYNITNSTGPFISPGEIARVLTIAPSADVNDMLGLKLENEPPEEQVRINLLNPVYTNIFQYLTVLDPTDYGLPFTETRIKGRININTAPPFVIAQLPWMEPAVAQAITAYRDTISGAFESIAETMYVPPMAYYATDALDLDRWPDITFADGAVDDFEERDIIFSRISNLVTVRSDIFTAYILVRIGVDGPQRRVIAVFDRSEVNSASDKVRIMAVHPVPDPR